MDRLMFTQYKCLSCGKWLKKSQRQEHERKFDHNIAQKGVVVKPKISELGSATARIPAPEGSIVEISRTKVEKSVQLRARELYPNTYLLLDVIKGLMLKP